MTSEALRQIWSRLGIPVADMPRYRRRVRQEAKRLVRIGRNPDGRLIRLAPRAAAAWRRMQAAAARDGCDLLPISGFRSVARQTKIIRRKLAAGQRLGDILRVNAVPGCSEHHTGRAIDVGSPADVHLTSAFARTREFRWLKKHAGRFGFRLSYPPRNRQGIAYEPWHWCWHPRQLDSR
jgi:D-alanyl-D-alanine carboxypeptidase